MSNPYPHLVDRVGWGHPSVLGRRVRERVLVGLSALVAVVLAFAASLEMPQPTVENMALALVITLAFLGLLALVFSTRYEVTLTVLALYLGLLDGPIKLEHPGRLTSAGRDVLIIAIAAGMLMRLLLKRQRLTRPPLSGWVMVFVAVVLVQAFNPDTGSILKVLGGYRQELEFVPFFFFGYLIIRSKQRFRQLFLLFGVIALANGLVGAYQSRLTPGQVATWGPGYAERIEGGSSNSTKLSGRTYVAEGAPHVRPTALGSDAGAGGAVGVIALPGLLALLAAGKTRRRWPVVLGILGALLAIGTSASRTFVVVGAAELVVFVGLALIARAGISRALAGLMAGLVLATGAGVALIALDGGQILHREEGLINPTPREGKGLEVEKEQGEDNKTRNLSEIPRDIADAPFGIGLGVTGAVSGFGGGGKPTLEEEKVSGGSAYNLLTVETGALGLFIWLGLSASVIVLGISRLRRIEDTELRLYLVGMLTAFIAVAIQGLSAPTLAVSPAGAFQWFAVGVLAFWIAGPGWATATARARERARAGTANALPPAGGAPT